MSCSTEHIDTNEPSIWYKNGLRFECQQCGDCCRIRGLVWVNASEIAQMARHLRMGYTEFKKTYVREVGSRLSLDETLKGECLMLDLKTGLCKAYPARPRQCSSYPFWPKFLSSPEKWERQRSRCPGLNRGRLWTYEEIQNKMRRD